MTLKNIKKGDYITNGEYTCKILARLEDIVFISARWETGEQTDGEENRVTTYYYYLELEKYGYKLLEKKWSANDLKEGDIYWFVDSVGEINYTGFENDKIDQFRVKTGNIYQTEEKAQEALDKILHS